MKFPLGRVVATPGALAAFEAAGENPLDYLTRHQNGDWGELDAEDEQSNNRALQNGERLMSAYALKDNTKIWVITERDRSATTFLTPDEY